MPNPSLAARATARNEGGHGFLDGGGSPGADEPKLEGLASLSAQRPEPARVCGHGVLVDTANLNFVIKDGPIMRRPSGAHREGHAAFNRTERCPANCLGVEMKSRR
jgi:hypothetical protein